MTATLTRGRSHRGHSASTWAASSAIAQEALNDVVRHAHAHCVSVVLDFEPDVVAPTMTDDGDGLPAQPSSSGGFGIISMRERAERLGGTVYVSSTLGHGVSVAARGCRRRRRRPRSPADTGSIFF
jgi:signal transduction histidine kinase